MPVCKLGRCSGCVPKAPMLFSTRRLLTGKRWTCVVPDGMRVATHMWMPSPSLLQSRQEAHPVREVLGEGTGGEPRRRLAGVAGGSCHRTTTGPRSARPRFCHPGALSYDSSRPSSEHHYRSRRVANHQDPLRCRAADCPVHPGSQSPPCALLTLPSRCVHLQLHRKPLSIFLATRSVGRPRLVETVAVAAGRRQARLHYPALTAIGREARLCAEQVPSLPPYTDRLHSLPSVW